MVVHICNTRQTHETEAGGLGVQGQPGLHSEPLSQKEKTKQNKASSVNISVYSAQPRTKDGADLPAKV
jgi:hypothetical protein